MKQTFVSIRFPVNSELLSTTLTGLLQNPQRFLRSQIRADLLNMPAQIHNPDNSPKCKDLSRLALRSQVSKFRISSRSRCLPKSFSTESRDRSCFPEACSRVGRYLRNCSTRFNPASSYEPCFPSLHSRNESAHWVEICSR